MDGLAAVTVGTIIFGLVSVALAFAYDWLAAHGHAIWLQVSVSGFVLGLIGLAYCWKPATSPSCGRRLIDQTDRLALCRSETEALLVQVTARKAAIHQRFAHPRRQSG